MTKHLTLLLFIGLAFWNCENEDACQIYKPLAGRYLNWEVDENCNITIIGIDYGISGSPSHYIYENGEYFQYVTWSDDSGAEWLQKNSEIPLTNFEIVGDTLLTFSNEDTCSYDIPYLIKNEDGLCITNMDTIQPNYVHNIYNCNQYPSAKFIETCDNYDLRNN